MGDLAINVNKLGKRYRIGLLEQNMVLTDAFTNLIGKPMHNISKGYIGNNQEYLWALKDVSFKVKKGEVLGIIGSNGAGKSTLLKILSRITEPTEGCAVINGRLGSLLEVGTGFHPELTGRDNIYLSGAILGMKKSEIDSKFEEIVKFSGVQKFLDTPLKHYSSGMHVRLGFSVAAHLDPDILIVDEVLAVGDAQFQKKCLGKMNDVAREGRTVLFVSHNMTAIRNLCDRVIWLKDGRIFKDGKTVEVTDEYLRQSLRADMIEDIPSLIKALPEDPSIRIKDIIIQQDGKPSNVVINSKPLEIKVKYEVLQRTVGLRVYFDLIDDDQNILIRSFHDENANAIPTMEPGVYSSTAVIPDNLLAPRDYEIRIRATIFNNRSCTGEGIGIPIKVARVSSINRGYPQDTIRSKLQPKIYWSIEKI